MKKPAKPISIGQVTQISPGPGFTRVVFKVEKSIGQLEFKAGQYIKLRLKDELGNIKQRSLSISKIQEDSLCLDIVAHEKPGVVSNWRRRLSPGDLFEFTGPGPQSKIDLSANLILCFADYSSIPALRGTLSEKQDLTNCFVLWKGAHQDLEQYFAETLNSENIKILANQSEFNDLIVTFPASQTSLWIAGERNEVMSLKNLIKNDLKTFKSHYISTYWQAGIEDELHRHHKKQDKLSN